MDAKWWPECLRHIRQWQKLGFGRLSATVKVTAPQRHEPLCILGSLRQASSREAWHRGRDVGKSVRYGAFWTLRRLVANVRDGWGNGRLLSAARVSIAPHNQTLGLCQQADVRRGQMQCRLATLAVSKRLGFNREAERPLGGKLKLTPDGRRVQVAPWHGVRAPHWGHLFRARRGDPDNDRSPGGHDASVASR